MTVFLSRILGQPVWDDQGQSIGHCTDLLAAESEAGFPSVCALALREGKKNRLISAKSVAWLAPSIILNTLSMISSIPTKCALTLAFASARRA